MGVTAGIFLASVLLKEMRYLVYIRYLYGNNMLTILFIDGRTTLFTPVDINLEQVVDFLNACTRAVYHAKAGEC